MAQSIPMNDIPITVFNCTGRNDFMIVIFTKNENPNAIDTPFVAWHTIKAQTSASLVYPVDIAVGAQWTIENQMDVTSVCSCEETPLSKTVQYKAGPFDCPLGSTWKMTMPFPDSSPDMQQVETAPVNPSNAIVLQNMKPASWSGRPFDFGLYKGSKLLVVQRDVGIGSQAVFQVTPRLYFGVVRDMKVGDVFRSLTVTQAYYEVNLNDYSNGFIIKLKMNHASGEYFFSTHHTS